MELTYYPANTSDIGLGSHKGFAFQRVDPPMALSWHPVKLAYEERELLEYCAYNSCIV